MLARRDLARLGFWLGASLAAAVVGGLLTTSAVQTWYPTLAKPTWTPPSWLFGPVWTLLYIMMGLAAFRVSRLGPSVRQRPLALFSLQLVLNVAWSAAFFGLQSPGAGLACIVALWAAVAATCALFWRADRVAGWLLVPYLAWTSFAAALNAAIWAMNGG